jgi:putative PIN family toxin of toxin-antitoxin system
LTRLVVDASALVSGIIGAEDRPPALLLDALFDRAFEPVICPRVLVEVRTTLSRPYFQRRITPEELDRTLRSLARACVQLRDPSDPPAVLRDPDDDYLVALALTARARGIVTGDKDLLDHVGLHPPALTLRAACELLRLL